MANFIKVKDILKIAEKTNDYWKKYGGLNGLCIHFNSGFNYLSVSFVYFTYNNFTQDTYDMELSEFFDKSNEKYWDEIQAYFEGFRFNTIYGDYEKGLLLDRVFNWCFDRDKGFPIINFDYDWHKNDVE